MPCTVRARLLQPVRPLQDTKPGEVEPVTTWQQQLNCSGVQHVDLGPATLHQPQLWWPIHMGVQVRPGLCSSHQLCKGH